MDPTAMPWEAGPEPEAALLWLEPGAEAGPLDDPEWALEAGEVPGGSPAGRLQEVAALQQSRLAAETERLQRELTAAAELLRAERESESRRVREEAARVEALAADRKRLRDVNLALEQQVAGVQDRLSAALAGSEAERGRLLALNEDLNRKLAAVQARLADLETRAAARLRDLEAEAERLREADRQQQDLLRQARDGGAASERRAEEAERSARALERALHDLEAETRRRLEPRLQAEFAERLKVELKAQAEAAEQRLAAELAAAREQAELSAEERLGALREVLNTRQERSVTEAALRAEFAAVLAQSRQEAQLDKERALCALRERQAEERSAAVARALEARGEIEVRAQEQSLQRLAAAQEEWRRKGESDAAALTARLEAQRDQALSELRAQKDAELAALRAQAERERERSEADLLRQVRREAESELNARTERTSQEWQKLKARFDEELWKVRDELKHREVLWQDKIDRLEREAAQAREGASLETVRLERELLAAVESGGKLAAERERLEQALRQATQGELETLAQLRAERDAALAQARAEKEAHEQGVAELRRDLEGKLKALDAQLREERKRAVELLAKTQELQGRPFWRRLGG